MARGGELIRLAGVTKRFGGLVALRGASFEIGEGEVHAVVGENGAGKSTLMKILAGVLPLDEGAIHLGGRPVCLSSPLAARREGITIVFQELNLFPHLTVAGNIFANREPRTRLGLLDERAMAEASREVLEAMGHPIDPRARVSALSIAERQIVEIARTLGQRSRIIILDEPNSALGAQESRRLFELIRRLRDGGVTILYVSHRLEEVFAIADRITVLRDGRVQGTWRAAETSIPEIVRAMIGRRIEEAFPSRPAAAPGAPGAPGAPAAPVLLDVRGLEWGRGFGPVSFEARAGEILGFAGLEGSGIDELFRALFGLEARTRGEVRAGPSSLPVRSPREAIRRGLALVPRSRREQGLLMAWPIRWNASLVVLERIAGPGGLLDGAAERRLAEDLVRRLQIVTESLEKGTADLSGGNQQKVLLAKWLASRPRILVLDDPTRGVDVGAKAEIYQLCRDLAAEGLAILFTSSEIEEVLGLADRLLVFARGRIVSELRRGEATKAGVLEAAAGGEAAGEEDGGGRRP